MKIISDPKITEWDALLKRPVFDGRSLESVVVPVLQDVKQRGDSALLEFTERFDKVTLTDLRVSAEERQEAANLLSDDLKMAIVQAKQNIHAFHIKQLQLPENRNYARCNLLEKKRRHRKVGLYIPGGSAPLFSTVLMLGIPQQSRAAKKLF